MLREARLRLLGRSRLRPHQYERGPAVEHEPSLQQEAVRVIYCERGIGLLRQQAGQNDACTRREYARDRSRQQFQRRQQNVGKHKIVGRAVLYASCREAARMNGRDKTTNMIEDDVSAGNLNRFAVNVACKHRAARDFGGGDRQHAGASADVEDLTRPVLSQQAVERQQAAPRCAVMAGPKRELRFYFDTDTRGCCALAIMRAVYQKASGLDRR